MGMMDLREELYKCLSEQPLSNSAIEKKAGVGANTIYNALYTGNSHFKTAVKLFHALGYDLKVVKIENKMD